MKTEVLATKSTPRPAKPLGKSNYRTCHIGTLSRCWLQRQGLLDNFRHRSDHLGFLIAEHGTYHEHGHLRHQSLSGEVTSFFYLTLWVWV